MSTKDYLIGNLSIIFCDAPYIYVSASISDVSKVEDSSSNFGVWYYIIIGFSIAIVIIVIVLVYYFSKKELLKTLKRIKERKNDSHKSKTPGTLTGKNKINKDSSDISNFSAQENETESKPKENKSFPSAKGDCEVIQPIPEDELDFEKD